MSSCSLRHPHPVTVRRQRHSFLATPPSSPPRSLWGCYPCATRLSSRILCRKLSNNLLIVPQLRRLRNNGGWTQNHHCAFVCTCPCRLASTTGFELENLLMLRCSQSDSSSSFFPPPSGTSTGRCWWSPSMSSRRSPIGSVDALRTQMTLWTARAARRWTSDGS